MLSYTFTSNDEAPSVITKGIFSTPVWIQQKWKSGEYAQFIQRNGCGHCCTAMALNLHGIKITPHEEFALCRKLWGIPRIGEPFYEDNFISASGIVKILRHFDISAEYFGVSAVGNTSAAVHIEEMMKRGNSVILWSHPSQNTVPNPFSPGEHYIYLAGILDDGRILVANSSMRSAAENGIQFTDCEMISRVLMEESCPMDYTWGRYDLEHSSGYVVIE